MWLDNEIFQRLEGSAEDLGGGGRILLRAVVERRDTEIAKGNTDY